MQSETDYLKRYDPNAFDRPSAAVDIALFTVKDAVLQAAVYLRDTHPGIGTWALPGGFVRIDEGLDTACARLLEEKLGLREVFIEQLYTFGAPRRDPRMRVISVAYYALVAPDRFDNLADFKAASARVVVEWPGETGGPVGIDGERALFLDHDEILGVAVARLRGKIDYAPIGFQLLPESFSLRELQEVHECVRGASLNKDSFRRRMLASGQLEATGERERDVSNRPAELYRFIRRSAV